MSYQAPSSEEVRTILKHFELTGSQAAGMLGMKNSRTIRKYTSDSDSRKLMQYSVLFTLVAKNLGILISSETWKETLISEGVLHQKKPEYMLS